MYNIDHETSPSIIDTLHAQEKTVICHMSVDSWEDYRSDANQYPASVLGNTLNEWPNEKWVDIRRLDLLGPILEARMDVAAAKGCDGIESSIGRIWVECIRNGEHGMGVGFDVPRF